MILAFDSFFIVTWLLAGRMVGWFAGIKQEVRPAGYLSSWNWVIEKLCAGKVFSLFSDFVAEPWYWLGLRLHRKSFLSVY